MGYGLVLTVPPAQEPVTIGVAKSHLNVGHSDDDGLIANLIAAAREQTEAETGRRWMPQTLTLSLPSFVGQGRCVVDWFSGAVDAIRLPVEPVSVVTAVRYYDQAGALQTLAGANYLTWLMHSPPLVYPAPSCSWPSTQPGRLGAVEVEFVAGYADAFAVPAAAKAAMLIAVGFWYEHRGDSEDLTELGLPPAALRLLRTLHTGHYS